MPYPKGRKRPANNNDTGSEAKKHKSNKEGTMLARGLRTARNGLEHIARGRFQHATISQMPAHDTSQSLRSRFNQIDRSKDGQRLVTPLAEKVFAYDEPTNAVGRNRKATGLSRHRPKKPKRAGKARPVIAVDNRKNTNSPLIIFNEEHIYNNFDIPKAEEYGLTIEPIDNCAKLLEDANLIGQKQSKQESIRLTRYTEKCIYSIDLTDDILITATGHGKTKAEAEANANLHAICILHSKGLFQDILPGGKYTVASSATMSMEGDAKKDVIDYAARHDCIPVFETHLGRSRLKKSMVTVTVDIPQLNLHGFGRATQAKQALVQACISLKQAAEAHHEKTGDGLLLVKDYTRLTTASSQKFLEYYCYQHKARYDTTSHATSGSGKRSQGDWTTTLTISTPVATTKASYDELLTKTAAMTARTFSGIPMSAKKDSEDTAFLAAALVLKQEEQALWKSFVKEMKRGNGEVLKPLRAIDIRVDYDAIEKMRQTVKDVNNLGGFNLSSAEIDSIETSSKRKGSSRQLTKSLIQQKNQNLKDEWEQYNNNPALKELREKRAELPMVQFRDKVMTLVNDNEVCVVVGATGSGKTTQLPQLILEQMTADGVGGTCNIICTQPRRIAAISVAHRVAVERNESLQQSIGYSVRFDSKLPKFGGSINYCTIGILLRQLQDSQNATLDGISHIIVDEVHERDIQIDFLLVILRQIMADRRKEGLAPIKIIMMSATIDTNLFCKYFGAGFEGGRCPYIEVPGRTFPVTQHFLDEFLPELKSNYNQKQASELYSKDTQGYVMRELTSPSVLPVSAPVTENNSIAEDDNESDDKATINWKSKGVVGEDGELELAMDKEDTMTPVGLMSVTIAHLLKTTSEGSILVFLPGLQEITALNRLLTTTKPLGMDLSNDPNYKLYMLHSAIPQMQQEVFEKLEAGRRKIILSTNIAETSITIPDVVYVVDSSKHRESQYDQAKRMSSLVSTWTSKSNAKQRAGRAGRVQNGHYYTMATKARYESFQIASQPEILRTDLQELCLQIKGMGTQDIGRFLQQAIEPPSAQSVENSIDHLQALRALDEDENLTPLGRLLSTLPVQPSLGKMVILGAIFQCLDPILILAAASTAKDPFLNPLERRSEAERVKASWAKGSGSDHAAVINAFMEWRSLKTQAGQNDKAFAFENFLHYNTLVSIAQTAEQILEIMQKSGLITRSESLGKRDRTFKNRYGTDEENANSDSLPLQAALATAGFYPNIAVQTNAPRQLRTAHENAAQIHLNSLAAPKSSTGNRYGPIAWQDAQPFGTLYTFSQKTQADQNNVNLRGLSKTSPLAVILFGGKSTAEGAVLRVDEWIPFFARGPQMKAIRDLSKVLDKYLEFTFARLGAANQQRLLARSTDGFLGDDRARLPLVRGIVQTLELCAPTKTTAQSFSRNGGVSTGGYSASGHVARGGSTRSRGRDYPSRSNHFGSAAPGNAPEFEQLFKRGSR